MVDDIYFVITMNRFQAGPVRWFVAVYSGAPAVFRCFRSLFLAVISRYLFAETEEICGFGGNRRCIFLE
jgi:hypothetical protein